MTASERVAKRVLEDGAVLRLLAAAFRYPDASVRERVARAFAGVRAAQAHRLARGSWSRLFKAAEVGWTQADGAHLESEHVRLFLGAAPCPLRETAYGDGRRVAGRAYELADIAGFYRAFGWKLAPNHPLLPDHLSTELEFASLLLVKEAYALTEGWDEQLAVTRHATKDFLELHLGRWVDALVAALVENRAPAVYVALADLVRATLARQCRRFRITPPPAESRLPRDFMQDETLECPRAPDVGREEEYGPTIR